MSIWNVLTGKYVYDQTLDFLVVGGGGASSQAGGTNQASGGGGGGVNDQKNVTFRTATPYMVKVGAGGVAVGFSGFSRLGNPGDYSQFYIYYATGGWGGDYALGGNSGTYGITTVGVIPSPTAGGGYEGGSSALANSQGYAIGGTNFCGGGAGAGQSAKNYYSGTSFSGSSIRWDDPGDGAISDITGTNTYYGGGGGSQAGGAGNGGGGNGYTGGNGVDGLGGGGGAIDYGWNGGRGAGGGGSGTIIIKQSIQYPIAFTTGNPTITSNSTFRRYRWTTAGTYTIIL